MTDYVTGEKRSESPRGPAGGNLQFTCFHSFFRICLPSPFRIVPCSRVSTELCLSFLPFLGFHTSIFGSIYGMTLESLSLFCLPTACNQSPRKNSLWLTVRIRRMESNDQCNFWYKFEECANAQPTSLFLVYEGRQWTYGEFQQQVHRWANSLLKLNIQPQGKSQTIL